MVWQRHLAKIWAPSWPSWLHSSDRRCPMALSSSIHAGDETTSWEWEFSAEHILECWDSRCLLFRLCIEICRFQLSAWIVVSENLLSMILEWCGNRAERRVSKTWSPHTFDFIWFRHAPAVAQATASLWLKKRFCWECTWVVPSGYIYLNTTIVSAGSSSKIKWYSQCHKPSPK